jgi:2-dehydropantoate 2-reductase
MEHLPVDNEPIVIIGMGAVGTSFAAWLSRTGRRIVACCCSPLTRATVDDPRGITTAAVEWVADPADLPSSRWVLLTTKMHHMPQAAPWLRKATREDSRILVLQNGVEHRALVAPHTDGVIVPALVYINAERIGIGSSRVRTAFRELILPNEPAAHEVLHDLLAGSSIRAEFSDDFVTDTWLKMLVNAAANPLTALTGQRIEVLNEPDVAATALALLDETVAVAHAEGANLPDDQAARTLAFLRALPAGSTSSMLADRLAGRSLEYDGMTGSIVRLGQRHGIPTPVSERILGELQALERSYASI